MLPANLIRAIQTLSSSGKSQTADVSNTTNKLEIGQQFQAAVQTKIADGLFKVQVAGQTLQMRLPSNIQSGDIIKLEVITTQPKITFSMAASTNPLSTPDQIGASARMLSNLAELPLERPIIQQLGNKAVWPSEQTIPDTKLLAGALREVLGKSGLFYESHQAQWIRGERSTKQLLEEPQNVLTRKNSLSSPTIQQPVSNSNSLPDLPDTLITQEPLKGSGLPGSESGQAMATGNDIFLPIAKELMHLVQQQLHTLEHHHLVWMGQIWPEQQMQWEIRGEPESRDQREAERQWSTEMELSLPNLGNVHARLVFAESGLRLTLHAADSNTVELFNRSLPQLKNSLASADISLVAHIVEKS